MEFSARGQHFPNAVSKERDLTGPALVSLVASKENKGTERDNQGVGWDMSIAVKLILTLDGNGRLFPQKSA